MPFLLGGGGGGLGAGVDGAGALGAGGSRAGAGSARSFGYSSLYLTDEVAAAKHAIQDGHDAGAGECTI